MTESVAKKARRAIKIGLAKSTYDLIDLFNLSPKEAKRCELVAFGRLYVKGKYVPKAL